MATAMKIRSCIKVKVKALYQKDVTDTCLFPEAEKNWKALQKNIVKEKRGEVQHHSEIAPGTVIKIYDLARNIKAAINARGTEEYEGLLKLVDVKHHMRMNYIIQYVAMLVLESYEVRRGCENIENLLATDFQVFDDDIYEFKYVRKVISEAEKQNPMGSNSRCAGAIPFITLAGEFDPGEWFEWYTGLLPEAANKSHGKNFLFPKPKSYSLKFNIHDPSQCMFEANKKGESSVITPKLICTFILCAEVIFKLMCPFSVGKTKIAKMLPELCLATGSPVQTNHCIRSHPCMIIIG
jgi:hypothetical protein